METIRLNNNDFLFMLSVVVSENESYMLQYNRIGQMNVSASVCDSITSIDFTYTDEISSSLIKCLTETGSEIINLVFKYPEEDKQFEANFVLDEVRLVSNEATNQTYRIKGTAVQYYEMLKNVAYSNQMMDASDVLKGLIGKAKLRSIDISEVEKNSGSEMQFISKTNESVLDQINYVLNVMSSKNSIYFLAYNFENGKYKVVNVGKSQFAGKKGTIKMLPTSEMYPPNNADAITEIIHHQKTLASDHNLFTDTLYVNMFDSKLRKWTRTLIDDIEMKEKNVPDNNYEFVFFQQKQEEKEAFSIIDEYDTNNNMIIGRRNRSAMLNADKLSVGMLGDLNVEVGDFMTIVCDAGMAHKFGGAWLINGVGHWFEKEKFTTRVNLSRSFRLKSDVIKG